jgi:hypothetical protein
MFHLVSYKCIRRTQYITPIGLFYKNVGRLWRGSDCEELVGVTHRRMIGLVLVGGYCFILLFLSPILISSLIIFF